MAVPPSSPRLPSPPPAAEIQIGPKSPAMAGATLAQQQKDQQIEQTIINANAKRRIHPGTRAADFAVGPPLVPLNELDSAFQLQEHLAALHYFHTASNTQPITRETALALAQPPTGTDRTLWLYELCRFLISQCNSLIVGFLFDTPPCSAATCPEMRASEWQFLCAVHEQPRSCCAIDYCCHTLDWAANVVTNPKIFPSRFVLADQHDKIAAKKNLENVFRRLHRIFAHAWFQHRGVFWSVEGQTGLYVLFKKVCDLYDLLPAENYKLPPEAEGLDTASSLPPSTVADSTSAPSESTPGFLVVTGISDRKNVSGAASGGGGRGSNTSSTNHVLATGPLPHRASAAPVGASGNAGNTSTSSLASDLLGGDSEQFHSVGRTNTRRHIRSSPSTGSAVTTVLEQDEDGAGASAAPVRPMSILQKSHRAPASARVTTTAVAAVAAVAVPLIAQQEPDVEEARVDSQAATPDSEETSAPPPVSLAEDEVPTAEDTDDKLEADGHSATEDDSESSAPQETESAVAEAAAEPDVASSSEPVDEATAATTDATERVATEDTSMSAEPADGAADVGVAATAVVEPYTTVTEVVEEPAHHAVPVAVAEADTGEKEKEEAAEARDTPEMAAPLSDAPAAVKEAHEARTDEPAEDTPNTVGDNAETKDDAGPS